MKNPVAESNYYNSLEFTKPKDALENIEYFCPDPNCPDPGKKLFLRKSPKDKKYFKHRVGMDHEIHAKTLLHKILVGQFKKIDKFSLPQSIDGKNEVEIDHAKSMIEFKGLEGDVPDIYLEDKDGFKCFIEVTISFPIEKKKMDAVKNLDIPLIEINVKKFFEENGEKLNKNIDFLMNSASELMYSSAKIVFLPSTAKTAKKTRPNTSTIIGGAVVLGAAGLATYLTLKGKK
jgi:hypothetical protein